MENETDKEIEEGKKLLRGLLDILEWFKNSGYLSEKGLKFKEFIEKLIKEFEKC